MARLALLRVRACVGRPVTRPRARVCFYPRVYKSVPKNMRTRSTQNTSTLTRVLHRSLAKSYRAAGGTRGELLCAL